MATSIYAKPIKAKTILKFTLPTVLMMVFMSLYTVVDGIVVANCVGSDALSAKKLGLEPVDCVAFEDSINGIKSAHAAGMTTVMVPDLSEPTDEIKPMIDFLCTDLSEAIERISN
jgi:hypothetical protein